MAIESLLAALAAQEAALTGTRFLAPCVAGAGVRTRVAEMVYTFKTNPAEFEGWGIFTPADGRTAVLVAPAPRAIVQRYLELLTPLRVRLAREIWPGTWLAYPGTEGDMRARFHRTTPIRLNLVTGGSQFDPALARFDGAQWWHEDLDTRADPRPAEHLRAALAIPTETDALAFPHLTPEMRACYEIAVVPHIARLARAREQPLRDALALAGGRFQSAQDRDDHWQVTWTTGDGEQHVSAIAKRDLTVLSSGICLSGLDADFDLASLVGVVSQR